MSRFVIITPGRSGSTFLAKSLNQHPEIQCEEEIFNRSANYKGSFNAFLASDRIYRVQGFLFNRERLSTLNLNLPLKWLITKFLKEKPATHYGFKISLDQLFAYPQLLSLLATFKVIYLTRVDKKRMVLSLLAARQTGNYDAFRGVKVRLEPSGVKHLFSQLLAWEKQCLNHFKDLKLINAELLFAAQEMTLKSIQDYLELKGTLTPIRSSRTHPESISEWVENYEEIDAFFSDGLSSRL